MLVIDTNKQVRNQNRNSNPENEETKNKDAYTRVITGPKDINITNSRDLRRKFLEYYPKQTYPNLSIKHARISVGGSFVIEFHDEETANIVEQGWKKEYFGGNLGMIKYNAKNRIGIIKNIDEDIDEDEVNEEIKQKYPMVEKVEFFQKNQEFIGVLKVTFKEANDLEAAMKNRFFISHRGYRVEEFERKPRVIKCNMCQRFGHVARRCRNQNNPRCGRCSEEGHQTKDCMAPPEQQKCYHCEEAGHITGSYKCSKVQEIYKLLKDNKNYG